MKLTFEIWKSSPLS